MECNGKIYYMGGYCDYTSTIYEYNNYEYDPKKNKWIDKANMLTGRSNFALVSNSSYIYAIGGDLFSDKNERYDPQKNDWVTLEQMITPRQHISGVIIKNKIYIIGGLVNIQGSSDSSRWSYRNVSNKNEVYDIEKNKWSELAPMTTRRHNVYLVASGNKILAFGGMGIEKDMWKSLDIVEEYDIIENKWTTKKKIPQSRDGFGIFAYDEKVYIIGGFSDSIVQNTVYIYDIVKNKWNKTTKFPNLKNGASASVGIGNKVYIIGGCDSNFTSNSNNYVGEII